MDKSAKRRRESHRRYTNMEQWTEIRRAALVDGIGLATNARTPQLSYGTIRRPGSGRTPTRHFLWPCGPRDPGSKSSPVVCLARAWRWSSCGPWDPRRLHALLSQFVAMDVGDPKMGTEDQGVLPSLAELCTVDRLLNWAHAVAQRIGTIPGIEEETRMPPGTVQGSRTQSVPTPWLQPTKGGPLRQTAWSPKPRACPLLHCRLI